MAGALPTCIGLYYPFIHFRNDDWVKIAALYWDKIGRIVPTGYALQDSETVVQLKSELGFIENFVPEFDDTIAVGMEFLTLLSEHAEQIVSLYRLSHTLSGPDPAALGAEDMIDNRPPGSYRSWSAPFDPSAPAGDDPGLAYIYAPKIGEDLQFALSALGLGRPAAHDTIAMHPRLAFVYMQALAAKMSSARLLHPLTDSGFDHIATGCTMERIADALLSENRRSQGRADVPMDLDVEFALVALESVVPKDIAAIPVEKIIQLRRRHGDELAAFRRYTEQVSIELDALKSVSDPRAFRAHLEAAYHDRLAPQLISLKHQLRGLGLETAAGALSVKLEVPALLTSGATVLGLGATHLNPILIATGAAIMAAAPLLRKYATDRRAARASSPAAYLLRVEEELTPRALLYQVMDQARAFASGGPRRA